MINIKRIWNRHCKFVEIELWNNSKSEQIVDGSIFVGAMKLTIKIYYGNILK